VLLTFFLALGAARALPAIALAEFSSISILGQFASVASLAIYMLSLALFVTTSPWLPDSNLWFVLGNVILVAPLTALAVIIFRSSARPALVLDDVAAADRAF